MMKKATRKLSDISFEKEGSAVALVGPHQGGPANAWNTLITKSTVDISNEQVEKASMVQVEMTITEFLVRFFNLWYDDAEVLARVMGYDTDADSGDSYEDWIDKRVEAITIMKSLVLDKEENQINKAVASLKPEELLAVLSTQKTFEQNLSSKEGVLALKGAFSPSVEISTNKGTEMTEFVTKAVHEEAVSKAVEEAVAKAEAAKEEVIKEKQAELDKALELVKSFEAKEKESVVKGRKETLKQAGVAEDEVEALFKSTEAIDADSFALIVKSISAKIKAVEETDLFKENGVSGESSATSEDGVAALTKALEKQYK